jgi:hypothetical protein
MMATAQRLDARSFFGDPQHRVRTFLPLVLKIFRNRFSCHGQVWQKYLRPSCSLLAIR